MHSAPISMFRRFVLEAPSQKQPLLGGCDVIRGCLGAFLRLNGVNLKYFTQFHRTRVVPALRQQSAELRRRPRRTSQLPVLKFPKTYLFRDSTAPGVWASWVTTKVAFVLLEKRAPHLAVDSVSESHLKAQ